MFTGLPFCRLPVTRQGGDSHPLSSGVIFCTLAGAGSLDHVGPVRGRRLTERRDLTVNDADCYLYMYYLTSKRMEEGR